MTRPNRQTPPLRLALVTLAVACTGADCVQLQPCVLPREAPLPEVLHLLNSNARLVQSLFTTDVDISGSSQGRPFLLGASMAVEKPRRFRLVARSALGSEELDLGSNDEQFWFWVARAEPPALYYCDHDQGSAAAVGFDPAWITEALGIGELQSGEVYEGPLAVGGGRLELRSHWRSAQGEQITKLTKIDACHGWIVEQALVDGTGRTIARAVLSGHRVDRASGAVVPRDIRLTWPEARLSLKLVLHELRVNETPVGGDQWIRPSKPEEIDLCTQRAVPLPTLPAGPALERRSRLLVPPARLGDIDR